MTQTPDQYFDSLTWFEAFTPAIKEEARAYYRMLIAKGRLGRVECALAAFHYANGMRAAKLMAA